MLDVLEKERARKGEEEECEECGYNSSLVNAIVDGQIKRICQRCVNANPVILIKKPHNIKEENIPRLSVHEILEKMSGLKPKPLKKPVPEIKLEDLRKRYEEIKEKRRVKKEIKTMLGEKEENRIDKIKMETKEIESEQQEQKEQQEQVIDFNLESAKHTKIIDLLEKMKKIDEKQEVESKEITEDKEIETKEIEMEKTEEITEENQKEEKEEKI